MLILFTSALLFSACGNSPRVKASAPYRPLDLRNQSDEFIRGANDGCETADGNYKKDHNAFNNDFEYNEGWWEGRRNCEGSDRSFLN